MDKESIFKVFIIATLIYYLVKGALVLLLREIMRQMEARGKKIEEKRRAYFAEKRRQRDERWFKNKKPPGKSNDM